MAKQTYIVTVDGPHGLSYLADRLLGGGRDWAAVPLDWPDQWPTEAWVAFERAQAARVAAHVDITDTRRHEGNKLEHPSFRYQEAIRELRGLVAVADAEVIVTAAAAIETGRFPLDTHRTPPHGDPLH